MKWPERSRGASPERTTDERPRTFTGHGRDGRRTTTPSLGATGCGAIRRQGTPPRRARASSAPLGAAPNEVDPSGAVGKDALALNESALVDGDRASSNGARAASAGEGRPTLGGRANARDGRQKTGDFAGKFGESPGFPGAPSATAFPDVSEAPREPKLDVEVRSLDAARSALTSNDARGALAALDDYDRRFSAPRLAPEAALLRVEALLAVGRRTEARQVGERWLSRDPSGAHADRLRALLDDASRSTGDQSKPARP